MRTTLTTALLAAGVALAGCASAPAATQVVSAEKPAEVDAGERTCRILSVSGSTLPRRVCKTSSEWERYDAAFADSDQSYRTDPQYN